MTVYHYNLCWEKLHLKVMHYNVVLLPGKVSALLCYFLWKRSVYKKSFLLISVKWLNQIIEGQQQKHEECLSYFTYLIIAGLRYILSLHFTILFILRSTESFLFK